MMTYIYNLTNYFSRKPVPPRLRKFRNYYLNHLWNNSHSWCCHTSDIYYYEFPRSLSLSNKCHLKKVSNT